jgi:hypothetical protein
MYSNGFRKEAFAGVVVCLRILIVMLIPYSLLLIPFNVTAQTITKSYTDKVASRFSDYEIIGKNDLGIVLHFFGTNDDEIVTYDDKLRIANRRELPYKGRDIKLENIILLKDKVLTFYTTKNETYQHYKLKVLDAKLNIPNETIVIDSLPLFNVGNSKAFYVKTSPDLSKLLLFNIIKTKGSFFIRFTIMTDSLRVLNRNLFTLTESSNASLKSIKINNQGNIIAVVGYEGGFDNRDYNYDKYITLTYNRTTNTIGEQAMLYQDYIFKNVITEISTQRDIAYIVSSYRSTKNKNELGIYYQIIDFRTNNVLLNSKMPFGEDILRTSVTNEFKAWQDKGTLVKPKRIIPRSDGGFILVTEGEYKFTRVERMQTTNNFGYYNAFPVTPAARYIEQNHYYDIGVFSVNTDGSLDWQTNMPKAQVSENDEGYYSSFAFFEANNVLKFLFNEDFYNIGNFVEYNVNPAGMIKRQSVMNSEKQNLVLVPLKGKQLDGRTIIIPSEQKRNLQLVLFQY